MFLTPLLWPRTFVKSTEDFFEKKPAAGEKFLGSLFSKIWRFLEKISKNYLFLKVFSASTTKKSPAQAKNLGTPFFARRRRAKNFPRTFSFSSEDPPKKIWWRRMDLGHWEFFLSIWLYEILNLHPKSHFWQCIVCLKNPSLLWITL